MQVGDGHVLNRRRVLAGAIVAGLVVLIGAIQVWQGDIQRTLLDPRQPFQTYKTPAAPDYAKADAWALLPDRLPLPGQRPLVDVFFVNPTIYDGGRDWNTPHRDTKADAFLSDVVLPNYAGPFAKSGRVFAPRYRAASLYAELAQRDDAVEARRFAYGDIKAAFQTFLLRHSAGRPFILAGVEQGGVLAERLLTDVIAPDPALKARLVAAYLAETPLADARAPIPVCDYRRQAGCLVAWVSKHGFFGEPKPLDRAVVWTAAGPFEAMGQKRMVCVNPLTGASGKTDAGQNRHLGGANASGLDWGLRPAPLKNEIAAHCRGGFLMVTTPESPSLHEYGGWVERRKVPPFNLFYADIEADALARTARYTHTTIDRPLAPPITTQIEVQHAPLVKAR